MPAILLTVKNILHAAVAVVMLIPILLTMGNAGDPDTPVETYPDNTNPYIAEYLAPDISAHRSGAGIAPQNTLMAFENIIEQADTLGVDTLEFDVQRDEDGIGCEQHPNYVTHNKAAVKLSEKISSVTGWKYDCSVFNV